MRSSTGIKNNLSATVPKKSTDHNLLIATWNIRDFDSNKFGHGYRMHESYYFIAQIISSFDLIAVQEVNKNLDGLNRLMYILGPNWDFLTTDVTEVFLVYINLSYFVANQITILFLGYQLFGFLSTGLYRFEYAYFKTILVAITLY